MQQIPSTLENPTNSASSDLTQQMLHNKIMISDVKDMYCQHARRNASPYEVNLIKKYNKIVYDWKRDVLEKKCDSTAQVIAGSVVPMWQMYWDGIMISKLMKCIDDGIVEGYSPDKLAHLARTFSTEDPEALVRKYGTISVVFMYQQFHFQITIWSYLQKWETVYSKHTDPLAWENLRATNNSLFNGEALPPGITRELIADAHELYSSIINLQPRQNVTGQNPNKNKLYTAEEIKQLYTQKTPRNATPFDQALVEEYNSIVEAWVAKVLNSDTVTGADVIPMWMVFWEGTMITRFMYARENDLFFAKHDSTMLDKEIECFDSFAPEDIVQDFGTLAAVFMYHSINYHKTCWVYAYKYTEFYLASGNPVDWNAKRRECLDLEIPFEEMCPTRKYTIDVESDAHEKHSFIVKLQPAVGKNHIR